MADGDRPVISRHARAGRRAFSQLVVDSLIASAAADLESARESNRRRDARRAERRLRRLHGAAGARPAVLDRARPAAAPRPASEPRTWLRGAAVWLVVTLAWLGGVAAIALHLVVHGLHGRLAVAGELGVLALTLAWFVVAVLRAPPNRDDGGDVTS